VSDRYYGPPDESGPPPEPTGAPIRELHRTSDIRLVMIQVAKLEERIGHLIDESKGHKKDFRWTWGGFVLGFLALAGFIIAVHNRIDDKMVSAQPRLKRHLAG
jgi:hypothetical protein